MSVRIRKYKRGGWEVDIRFEWPDGTELRERRRSAVRSKSASQRWGEARERELLAAGQPRQRKEVPTLREFRDRFIAEYCEAERQKPSGIERKQCAFRCHLLPALGDLRLDQITNAKVQTVKASMTELSPKSVNNVLTVLNKLLKVAVDWDVIESMPCQIRLLPVDQSEAEWYEPHDYRRLAEAAAQCDVRVEVMVRLGADAGLRRGEMMALRWCDIDLRRGMLTVRKAIWNGHETAPKGGRGRQVPMTRALQRALRKVRHLRGPRVLYRDDGGELTAKVVRRWMEQAQRRAGLEVDGGVHQLRHTFCSTLAARGAPAKAIQELAGHADLSTSMRYMHLSPSNRQSAIRLLDEVAEQVGAEPEFGDILETAGGERPEAKKIS